MTEAFLRIKTVAPRVGLSRTTVWRMVKAGTFPAPKQLGVRAVGWPLEVIDEWMESRPQAVTTRMVAQNYQGLGK